MCDERLTYEQLEVRLKVAEDARDFWYRTYTGASTKVCELIERNVTGCLVQDFENDGGCEEILRRLEKRLKFVVNMHFVTSGVKSGVNATPYSLQLIERGG